LVYYVIYHARAFKQNKVSQLQKLTIGILNLQS